MSFNAVAFGKRARIAMVYAGFESEEALAKKINELMGRTDDEHPVAQQTINRILKANLKTGRSSYFPWIALACGVRIEWLLKGEKPMTHGGDQKEKTLLENFRQLPQRYQREILELIEFKLSKAGGPRDELGPEPQNLVRFPR